MINVFPFKNYKKAWVDFRKITNETSATAEHLIYCTSIENKKSIIDLGCGDGSLIKAIAEYPLSAVKEITLVEIASDLIRKAKKNVQNVISNIEYINENIVSIEINKFKNFDAIIA